jgi:hypothetical protein
MTIVLITAGLIGMGLLFARMGHKLNRMPDRNE